MDDRRPEQVEGMAMEIDWFQEIRERKEATMVQVRGQWLKVCGPGDMLLLRGPVEPNAAPIINPSPRSEENLQNWTAG